MNLHLFRPIEKSLNVVQTFRYHFPELMRIGFRGGFIAGNVKEKPEIARDHVRDTIAIIGHRTETATGTHLKTQSLSTRTRNQRREAYAIPIFRLVTLDARVYLLHRLLAGGQCPWH